jgi:hypothetical protein
VDVKLLEQSVRSRWFESIILGSSFLAFSSYSC